jgi:HD-GYP domain-containing protein (c-di-GMP phosphodiesterase class II)
MAHLLIWGATRDLVEGALTASIQAEHVTNLAELRAALGTSGLALVLADPACLEAERTAVEAWLLEGGSAQAVIMAVAHPADADQVLERLPFVDDIILRPLSAARLRLKLSRALETVQSRRVVRQLEDALAKKNEDLKRRGQDLSVLNDIGVKLSAERDIDKLLALILSKSREITSADAGSLYLVKRAEEGNGAQDQLQFMLPQNDTLGVGQFERVTMPLDESSLAGYTAVTGKVQNVPDAYELGAGSAGSRAFDERSGYRTKSMLVIPMRDHKNEVIGVVQLINKKRSREAVLRPLSLVDEIVIPFTKTDEELVSSLASQAAVAFENADLIQRIRQLFDDFILAAVRAVELRDPTTLGHSRRVAVLTVSLAEKIDAVSTGPLARIRLSRDQMEELRYAALLHDFGKVAVEEKYLKKEKKLYATELIALRQRFAYIARANEARYLQGQLELLRGGRGTSEQLARLEAEYLRRKAEIEHALGIVLRANEPTVVDSEEFRREIERLDARPFAHHKDEERFPVEEWAEGPFLTADEKHALLIKKGSLTPRERDKINEHVTHTYEFLRKIPWTGEFRRIPEIAHAHHEKLNGSGYPRRLQAPEIPDQSRMMTISDIYDALVAIDRPYKDPISTEKALGILESDMRRGDLDSEMLKVFVEAKVYEHPDFKAQLRPKS